MSGNIPDEVARLTVKAGNIRRPRLLLAHTPGWKTIMADGMGDGEMTLFSTTMPSFGLSFRASLTWFTEEASEPRLSFYMDHEIQYWNFESVSEIRDLADHAEELRLWLTDIGRVVETITQALPDVEVLSC